VERKVVVTNLEQKESNLEKDKANELESSSTANPDADLNPEATPSIEPSMNDGNDEVEVNETDSSSTQKSLETSKVDEVTIQIAEDDASENDPSSGELETEVVNKEDDQIEEHKATADKDPETAVAEEEDSAPEFYTKILEKAQLLITQEDWAFISNELANLALHISQGPESTDDVSKENIHSFNVLRGEFEERKKAHYAELNKRKEENLVAKKGVLKQLNDLISEERWTDTKTVNQLKGKWEHIKFLPQGEVEALNTKFESLLKEFESHKVDRLVKKLQQEEENLTLKLVILEKMDVLNKKVSDSNSDYDALNSEFQDLLVQWRKIGRVPSEKNQQVWDNFNLAQDQFNELRFKHDKKYRIGIERSLEKKKKLVTEAESLIDDGSIADAARRVNKLHKAWKKTGNLPQKEENELWDKFKAATDAFNEKKTENIDQLREEENKNLIAKQALIQRAIAAQSAESYEEGHQAMQQLMGEWKKIGSVPRKKSSKVWKQFKEAMDAFYEKRREHFKSVRKDQKDNLTLKKEIINKLGELVESEDAAKAVEKAKQLQAEFKKIGHVPLKFKNKIWKDYREVCDKIYNNFRASGADLGMERKLASEGIEPGARKQIIKYQKELEALRKTVSKLESEMIQFEEAQTYFKPTNKGNKLRNELQTKIDNSVESIAIKKRKISEVVQKINELKSVSE
jgi:hypothetical protein